MGTLQDRINHFIDQQRSAENESLKGENTLKERIDDYLNSSPESEFPTGEREGRAGVGSMSPT